MLIELVRARGLLVWWGLDGGCGLEKRLVEWRDGGGKKSAGCWIYGWGLGPSILTFWDRYELVAGKLALLFCFPFGVISI